MKLCPLFRESPDHCQFPRSLSAISRVSQHIRQETGRSPRDWLPNWVSCSCRSDTAMSSAPESSKGLSECSNLARLRRVTNVLSLCIYSWPSSANLWLNAFGHRNWKCCSPMQSLLKSLHFESLSRMQKATTDKKLSWSALAFIQLLVFLECRKRLPTSFRGLLSTLSSFFIQLHHSMNFRKWKRSCLKKPTCCTWLSSISFFSGKMHVHAKRQYAAPGSWEPAWWCR